MPGTGVSITGISTHECAQMCTNFLIADFADWRRWVLWGYYALLETITVKFGYVGEDFVMLFARCATKRCSKISNIRQF